MHTYKLTKMHMNCDTEVYKLKK